MTAVDELRQKQQEDKRGVVVVAHGVSGLELFESLLLKEKCTEDNLEDDNSE